MEKQLRTLQLIMLWSAVLVLITGCETSSKSGQDSALEAGSETPTETHVLAAGAIANHPHWVWITATGLTANSRVVVKKHDATWSYLNEYPSSALNIDLSQSPQVITLALTSAEEHAALYNGLILTVENGRGTWDSVAIEAPTINLFLVMGQSNAVGFRGAESLLPFNANDGLVPFYFSVGNPGSYNCVAGSSGVVPLGAQTPPSPCLSPTGQIDYLFAYGPGFGPEIGISRTLQAAGRNDFAIFKFAINGSAIAGGWDPAATPSAYSLYSRFQSELASAIDTFKYQGFKVRVEALFWIQGESDSANLAPANAYSGGYQRLLAAIRSETGYSTLPVIAAKVAPYNPSLNPWVYANTVNLALAAQSDVVVESSDLPVDIANGDGVHYNSQGLLTLGERLANAYLSK